MRRLLVIVICATLLHQHPAKGAGLVNNDCNIQTTYDSPYVKPYYEGFVAVATGCVSTENSSRAQEVHVLNLLNGVTPGDRQHGTAKVTLHIKPYTDTGLHAGPLVFVLSSERPVEWRLQTDRISNRSRNIFWVSQGSRVSKDSGIRVKVKKLSLPHETEELATWTRNKFHAISSFTQVAQANSFIKKVGRDSSLPGTCTISSNFYHPSSRAMNQQLQNLRGCAAPQNEGAYGNDVHIVELLSASTNQLSQQVSDVVVEVTTRERPVGQKHLMLILKSHKPVKWHIRAKGVRGSMDIIVGTINSGTRQQVDHPVDTSGVTLQPVRETVEDLTGIQGDRLVEWVREKYSLPASYSYVQLANRIELTVDGAEAQKQNGVLTPGGGRRGKFQHRTPFDDPSKTRVAINQAKTVECQNQGILVTLRQPILQLYGVRMEHLSLLDSACGAQSNRSHYILNTQLSLCGTQERRQHDSTVYQNAIVVRRVDEALLTIDEEEEGSAMMADMVASGYVMDDTHMDDEDYLNMDTINVNFQCEYTTPGSPIPTGSRIEPSSGLSYQLDLYSDSTFSTKLTTYPNQVEEKQLVYVKATVNSDPSLHVVIQNCWVAPSGSNPGATKHRLITKGCKFDKTVEYYQPAEAPIDSTVEIPADRFSFKFYKFFEEDTLAHLECQLAVCTRDPLHQGKGIGQCMTQDRLCLTQQMVTKNNEHVQLSHSQMVYKGPLVLHQPNDQPPWIPAGEGTPHPNDSVQKGEESGSRAEVSQPCEQIVRIEGLDSGTVVGIAFAAFIIGVLLTAALWFIHTHTGPMRNANRPRSTETSGESTPSSTAPITIHQIHT